MKAQLFGEGLKVSRSARNPKSLRVCPQNPDIFAGLTAALYFSCEFKHLPVC